jgi:hypothetical protein
MKKVWPDSREGIRIRITGHGFPHVVSGTNRLRRAFATHAATEGALVSIEARDVDTVLPTFREEHV